MCRSVPSNPSEVRTYYCYSSDKKGQATKDSNQSAIPRKANVILNVWLLCMYTSIFDSKP